MKKSGRTVERIRELDLEGILALPGVKSIADLAKIYACKFETTEKAARGEIDRTRAKGCTLQFAKDLAESLSEKFGRHFGVDEVAPIKDYTSIIAKHIEEAYLAAKNDLERVSYCWDGPVREMEAAASVSLPALLTIVQVALKQPRLVEKDELVRYGLWLQEVAWTASTEKALCANKLAGEMVQKTWAEMRSSRPSEIAEHLFYHNDFRDTSQLQIFGISVKPIMPQLAKSSCINADKSLNALICHANLENSLGFGESPAEMRIYQLAQNSVAYLHRDRKISQAYKGFLSELKSYSFCGSNIRQHLRVDLQQLQFQGKRSAVIELLEMAFHSLNGEDKVTAETRQSINLNLWALNGKQSGDETLIEEVLTRPDLRWLLLRDKTFLLPVTWRFLATNFAQRNIDQTWLRDLFPPCISAEHDKISKAFSI